MWLEVKQEEGFDEVKQLLFSMMPLLATVSDGNLFTQIVIELKPEFQRLIDDITAVIERTANGNPDSCK